MNVLKDRNIKLALDFTLQKYQHCWIIPNISQGNDAYILVSLPFPHNIRHIVKIYIVPIVSIISYPIVVLC